MYLSAASVSTGERESPETSATDDGEPAPSGSFGAGDASVRRGAGDAGGASGTPDSPRDDAEDADDADDGGSPVRTRLVESTVVAAITGVFVVLGGSTQIDPYLSLPVALAGVLWLFVRTLPSVRRRSSDTATAADDARTADPGGGETSDAEASGAQPTSRPISTDRRIKMEIAEHGGRMMQKELVDAVDLSESAVSRRLSNLEESEEVGRVCLGRENLVYLEGSRPEGADSPFAEE